MGREAEAQASFGGRTGLVRALLESDALILRGALRLRIPRSDLQNWQADGDDLHLHTAQGPVTLTLNANEALRWVAALNRPLPTLHDKLGLGTAKVWILARIDDGDLAAALQDKAQTSAAEAGLGIAVLRNQGDLERLLMICSAHPDMPVWAINEKGKQACLPESVIRTALRGLGMVDTKACAVSSCLSGTRYQRRRV